jgi:hypothetical protein
MAVVGVRAMTDNPMVAVTSESGISFFIAGNPFEIWRVKRARQSLWPGLYPVLLTEMNLSKDADQPIRSLGKRDLFSKRAGKLKRYLASCGILRRSRTDNAYILNSHIFLGLFSNKPHQFHFFGCHCHFKGSVSN